MQWLFLTDEDIVAELRQRCRRERLLQNMTQQDLATRAGVGISTVRRFEGDGGYAASLDTFVRILRVLGAVEALEQILPERPLDPLNPNPTTRLRARPKTTTPAAGQWAWADQ